MTDQDRADTIDVLDGYENIGYPWAKDIYSDWTEFVEGYGREKAEEILKQAEIDWPPESVSIDISTKCNLRCPMCMSNGDAEGRADDREDVGDMTERAVRVPPEHRRQQRADGERQAAPERSLTPTITPRASPAGTSPAWQGGPDFRQPYANLP